MKKFNIGDTVAMIKDGAIVEGVVKKIIDVVNPPIMAVDFDGSIEKVHANTVMLVQKSETKDETESEEKTETNEARPSVIRCPKERYLEALKNATDSDVIFADDSEDGAMAFAKGMTALMIGIKISEVLFGDKNEIDLDKYMLLWEIVNELTPSKLAEQATVGRAGDFTSLSGALIDIFMNLITELFGAEND